LEKSKRDYFPKFRFETKTSGSAEEDPGGNKEDKVSAEGDSEGLGYRMRTKAALDQTDAFSRRVLLEGGTGKRGAPQVPGENYRDFMG